MKILSYLFLLVLFASCKKDSPIPDANSTKNTIIYTDSVSFVVNGRKYSFEPRHMVGMGNRQFNLKPYPTPIEGRRVARRSEFYWYGAADSILYSAHYNFETWPELSEVNFLFTKKYRSDQLKKDVFLVPDDNSELLKVGKQTFAVDLEQEATLDGIAIEARLSGIEHSLTSYIPNYYFWLPVILKKDIQDNSIFEITKVQKLDNDKYLVEATFELNLFDKDSKAYRLEKGFLRLVTDMKVWSLQQIGSH